MFWVAIIKLKFILFQVIFVSVLVNYNPIESQCNGGARRKYALRERLFTISIRIPPHPKRYKAKNLIKTQWISFASTRYHFTVVVVCGAVSH